MSKKIGIAVSVYDKFDDLAVLHDILRENFDQDYYISVHSTHPDAKKEIVEKRDLEIDSLSYGDSIPNTSKTGFHLRVLNSLKQSCSSAMKECDYVMHLHADAWPLNEKKLLELIEILEESDKEIAVRGKGTTWQRVEDYRLGQVMDQFFVFKSSSFEEKDFFEFDLLDPMPHWGIHDAFMTLLLGKIGRSNMYFYSYMDEDQYWDGEPTEGIYLVRPSAFDPEWKFFHCAKDEFLEDYGKEVQAMRLRQEGLSEGKHIQDLLKNHSKKSDEINRELKTLEKRQNIKLLGLLCNPHRYGRAFDTKQRIIDSSLRSKLGKLLENLVGGTYYKLNDLVFKFIPYENRARRLNELSPSAEWPRKDHEVYRSELKPGMEDKVGEKWYQKNL